MVIFMSKVEKKRMRKNREKEKKQIEFGVSKTQIYIQERK